MFPVEIWEKVFHHVDATSLIRFRTVSTTWNAIINKHLTESCAWYNVCKRDIPEKYWLMLLENSFLLTSLLRQENVHDPELTYNNKIWITMYRAWVKWRCVQNYNELTTDEFRPIPKHRPSERITCCAVLGDLVAVGSTEGYIQVINLRTNQLVFRADQYKQVQDIKLCVQGRNNQKIVLISTSIHNTSRVWDITCQKCLMKISSDAIGAGYGYFCATRHNNAAIFVHNAITEDSFSTRLFIRNSNNTNNLKYVNLVINKSQLCFLSNNGYYCELDLQDISQDSNKFLYTPESQYIGVPKNEKVRRYYLFNPHVVFCVTDNGHLGISVHKNKWRMFNVFPIFYSIVTAILFYVRVLIVGFESGDVVIFPVENELELEKFNFFHAKKSKKIHVASEPIVSLHITEIADDQKLLVATTSTLYHIKLDSVANQN